MKRFLILTVVILILVCTGIGVAVYYSSTKVAHFNLDEGEYTVVISEDDGDKLNKVTELSKSQDVRLTKGNYVYSVNGTDFDNSTQAFTVQEEDITVTVSLNYSNDYLGTLLNTEISSIETVLRNRYPSVQYTVDFVKLYKKGEWAAGIANPIVDPRELPDKYRFVLHKKGDSWDIVVPPTIAIDKTLYKDVPIEVLYDLYSDR